MFSSSKRLASLSYSLALSRVLLSFAFVLNISLFYFFLTKKTPTHVDPHPDAIVERHGWKVNPAGPAEHLPEMQ